MDGDGPAILLMHGFTDSADTWRPVLTELAAVGRRAVAVDLPGHGHAAPLGRPAFAELDAFTDAFVAAHADGAAPVLAGNSLGGLFALRAAARGDTVSAVAGLDPAGLAHTLRLQVVAALATWFDPWLGPLDRVPVPAGVVRRGTTTLHRRLTEGQGDPELAAYYTGHVHGLRDVARWLGDLAALSTGDRQHPLALADIDCPVLLIWGRRDRIADIRGADRLLAVVPNSRLAVVDAGHCPQIQLPHQVARLLADLPESAPRRDTTTRTTTGEQQS